MKSMKVNEEKNSSGVATETPRPASVRSPSRKMLAERPSDLDELEVELWNTLSVLFERYCGNDETRWADRMASFEAVEGPLFRPIRQHMNLGRRKAMLAIQRQLQA